MQAVVLRNVVIPIKFRVKLWLELSIGIDSLKILVGLKLAVAECIHTTIRC